MEAIVLAGGFGTRLASVISDIPKPMALVAGRPFLTYVLDYLKREGVTHIVLAVCHKKECIMNYFGSIYQGIQIDYSVEEIPLGTGGAIKQAMNLCKEERVFVLNGDSFLSAKLQSLREYSVKQDCLISIVLKPLSNFSRYGTVEVEANGIVCSFREKQPCEVGLINAGIYDIRRDTFQKFPLRFGMEQDCFPVLLEQRQLGSIICGEYFIDIGIPEDYERIQAESELLTV